MSLARGGLSLLALLLLGGPALASLLLASAAFPRENCTLDDQAIGHICSDYGSFYWAASGIFGLALLVALFLILRKRSAN